MGRMGHPPDFHVFLLACWQLVFGARCIKHRLLQLFLLSLPGCQLLQACLLLCFLRVRPEEYSELKLAISDASAEGQGSLLDPVVSTASWCDVLISFFREGI